MTKVLLAYPPSEYHQERLEGACERALALKELQLRAKRTCARLWLLRRVLQRNRLS